MAGLDINSGPVKLSLKDVASIPVDVATSTDLDLQVEYARLANIDSLRAGVLRRQAIELFNNFIDTYNDIKLLLTDVPERDLNGNNSVVVLSRYCKIISLDFETARKVFDDFKKVCDDCKDLTSNSYIKAYGLALKAERKGKLLNGASIIGKIGGVVVAVAACLGLSLGDYRNVITIPLGAKGLMACGGSGITTAAASHFYVGPAADFYKKLECDSRSLAKDFSTWHHLMCNMESSISGPCYSLRSLKSKVDRLTTLLEYDRALEAGRPVSQKGWYYQTRPYIIIAIAFAASIFMLVLILHVHV